ncbi:MAG: 4Fe-4S dicluster domain-containing protein [Clostridia bacterium]|nr:4Fe-4S dicluster domain-containing protein [Clostridia bacterium]
MQLFLRGIVLPFQKGKALERGIENLTPDSVRLPVATDDSVFPLAQLSPDTLKGQGEELCLLDGMPVVSTISGTVEGTLMIHHPLYGPLQCADVLASGSAESRLPIPKEEELTPDAIIEIARQAAVYDELDGIPLWEKLTHWQMTDEDLAPLHSVLVADGTANDVFGSAPWAVLKDQPGMVLYGLQMAAKAIRFTRCHIATMLPKKRRRALKKAVGRANVYIVGDEYPVTVFADKHMETYRIGVQACLALAQAIKQGKRHTHTVVTVAGSALPAPRNFRVPFGTDIDVLLSACQAQGGYRLVLGDAMTGITSEYRHVPLLPGMTTILAMMPRRVRTPGPCIGCGRCADICHAGLLPYEIVRRSENMHYERLQHLSPTACDGCGACSYICPAGRDVAAEVIEAGKTKGTVFLHWGEDDHE